MSGPISIRTASFRILHSTPGHATYGVWVNGGKCGALVVRQEDLRGTRFAQWKLRLQFGGWTYTDVQYDPAGYKALIIAERYSTDGCPTGPGPVVGLQELPEPPSDEQAPYSE